MEDQAENQATPAEAAEALLTAIQRCAQRAMTTEYPGDAQSWAQAAEHLARALNITGF